MALCLLAALFFFCFVFCINLKEIGTRYKKIGYNMDILRQTACMAANLIMGDNFASS